MIRRDVLRRDNRPVKWSLVAAAFALSLGLYAEHVLDVEVETEAATSVLQEADAAATAATSFVREAEAAGAAATAG